MPVVKNKLYMKHRRSAIFSLANFNIFMEMLFIPVALLLSRLYIIVQVDIGNDSLQVSVK